MKKLFFLLCIILSLSHLYSQVGRMPYQTVRQSYRGDTVNTTLGIDNVEFSTNLDGYNFNKQITVAGILIKEMPEGTYNLVLKDGILDTTLVSGGGTTLLSGMGISLEGDSISLGDADLSSGNMRIVNLYDGILGIFDNYSNPDNYCYFGNQYGFWMILGDRDFPITGIQAGDIVNGFVITRQSTGSSASQNKFTVGDYFTSIQSQNSTFSFNSDGLGAPAELYISLYDEGNKYGFFERKNSISYSGTAKNSLFFIRRNWLRHKDYSLYEYTDTNLVRTFEWTSDSDPGSGGHDQKIVIDSTGIRVTKINYNLDDGHFVTKAYLDSLFVKKD